MRKPPRKVRIPRRPIRRCVVSAAVRPTDSTPPPLVDWRDLMPVEELAAMTVDELRDADALWRRLTVDERARAIEDARLWREGSAAEAARHGFESIEAFD